MAVTKTRCCRKQPISLPIQSRDISAALLHVLGRLQDRYVLSRVWMSLISEYQVSWQHLAPDFGSGTHRTKSSHRRWPSTVFPPHESKLAHWHGSPHPRCE